MSKHVQHREHPRSTYCLAPYPSSDYSVSYRPLESLPSIPNFLHGTCHDCRIKYLRSEAARLVGDGTKFAHVVQAALQGV